MKVSQITEYPKDLKQPYYKNNHYNDIQNTFYFSVHRNVIVNQIKDYPYNNNYKQ